MCGKQDLGTASVGEHELLARRKASSAVKHVTAISSGVYAGGREEGGWGREGSQSLVLTNSSFHGKKKHSFFFLYFFLFSSFFFFFSSGGSISAKQISSLVVSVGQSSTSFTSLHSLKSPENSCLQAVPYLYCIYRLCVWNFLATLKQKLSACGLIASEWLVWTSARCCRHVTERATS